MPGFTLPSATLLAQSILSGIFVGALYGLMGLGLSLSWGLLRLINLAHFAFAFLAAYLCYQLASLGVNSLLLTFGLMGIVEALIQSIWTADFRKLESLYSNLKFKIGVLYFPVPEL